MNGSLTLRRCIAHFLLLSFATLSLILPTTQAGMIGTSQIAAGQQAKDERARLTRLLQRDELVAQLQAAGVSAAQVEARVAALGDDEVSAIVDQLDQVPAGGDIIGVLVFLFLVLLATDIAGYTEIFPFVKRTVADHGTHTR